MYAGQIDKELGALLSEYEKRFGTKTFGLMCVPGNVSRNRLAARLERALADGNAIDVFAEFYPPETAKQILSGEILI